MKLGNYAHISICVHNLPESSAFYEKVGFRKLWGKSEPHPWALFTDGTLNIHLYEFPFTSPALHYFSKHMKDKVLELMRLGIRPEQQRSRDGNRVQHSFTDPNELCIMLMHYSDTDMPVPNGPSFSRLGTFGEFSISTENLRKSVEFWQQLDFFPVLTGDVPYPWATLSDGVITLGLHQSATFSTPALTYYSLDAADRIARLKSESFTFSHELKNEAGRVEGAILTAPDGQPFFLLTGTA